MTRIEGDCDENDMRIDRSEFDLSIVWLSQTDEPESLGRDLWQLISCMLRDIFTQLEEKIKTMIIIFVSELYFATCYLLRISYGAVNSYPIP